jgi:membrane protease YdiL (CAAX protease family)
MDQLVVILALASLATLGWLASHRAAGRQLLPYEPRRPVPWSFIIVALALAPALLSIAGAATGSPPAELPPSTAESEPAPSITVADLWQFAFLYIFLAVMCYVVLAVVFRADRRDLGLPQGGAELASDIRAGAVAYLAALLPVYSIQLILVSLLEGTDQHPILVELEANRSAAMILAAGLGAVVGAPLFEETAFRLIFQGWLEKHEAPPRHGERELNDVPVTASFAPMTPANPPIDVEIGDTMHASAGPAPDTATIPFAVYDPERPCNWAPILVSSALFALAHIGQGVAPFSLFPLALVLGYLYQRTHRIVPSIVCHALFNATTLLAVWAADPQQLVPTLPAN